MPHSRQRSLPAPPFSRLRAAAQISPDERVLLRLLAFGQTTAQAARTLGITPEEAEARLLGLQTRLQISRRPALLARAVLNGWF